MISPDLNSRTIGLLRFPFMLLVVYVHAFSGSVVVHGETLLGNAEEFSFFHSLQTFVSYGIAEVSVPGFFLISGYLFFRSASRTDLPFFREKLTNRFFRLVIPYIFWNLFVFLLYYTAEQLPYVSSLFSGEKERVSDYGWGEFANIFWVNRGRFPICFQFWYVRDLILISFCAPLVAWFVNKGKRTGLLLLFLGWLLMPAPYGIPDIRGVFFFTAGAWLALNALEPVSLVRRWRKPLLTLYPLLAIADFLSRGTFYHQPIQNLAIVTGVAAAFALGSLALERRGTRVFELPAAAVFLVYALHEPILSFLKKGVYVALTPRSEWAFSAIYLLLPPLVVVLIVALYRVTDRFAPSFLKGMMGLAPFRRGTNEKEYLRSGGTLS